MRNVIAVIAGRAEMLGSEVLGPLNVSQRRSLDILIANVERLTTELDALAELFDAPPPPTD